MRYYLNTLDFPIEAVYEANEPVFDLPKDPLDYYRWAWEVIFPHEDYQLKDLDDYVDISRYPP